MRSRRRRLPSRRASILHASIIAAALLASCGGGDGGFAGPAGPSGPPGPGPLPIVVGPYDPLPGVNVVILSASGGSGAGGTFLAGDRISVLFSLETDGSDFLDLTLMDSGSIYLSGPTTNYARVIAEQTDVRAASVYAGNGTWRYTFAPPIPAAYLAPYNDTPSFGTSDGELTGQPLLDGTYTVGIEVSTLYLVGSATKRDAGSAVFDLRLGTASVLLPREVVTDAHCAQCHDQVVYHEGRRVGVRLCLLCHTSGAEDRNDPGVLGGTPGVSIAFKVMAHKIHSASRLPSVLGVGTKVDGTRDYLVTPKPYRLVGTTVADFSGVRYPVAPAFEAPMPRDTGYSLLTAAAKAKEDAILRGVVACAKCHGDPDGPGGIAPPADGTLHESQPSMAVCGACHDDVDWTRPYQSNGSLMPISPGACTTCHPGVGNALAVRTAHLHPLRNATIDPGVAVNLQSVTEGTGADGDTVIEVGERVRLTFTLTDGSGAPIMPASLGGPLRAVLAGPTSNSNLLLAVDVPTSALVGAQPFSIHLPEPIVLERVGVSSGAPDTFFTARAPHRDGATAVLLRTGFGAGLSGTLGTSAAQQSFLDVGSTAGFLRDDFVVVEDGVPGFEEYARVTLVDGSRLWFAAPLRFPHAAGSSVAVVTLAGVPGASFTLDPALGRIDETTEFGAGVVLVSYVTDYLVPATYPPPLNDSPDLGEEVGEWTGKALVDGTYSVVLSAFATRNVTVGVPFAPETTTYRSASPSVATSFRIGTAGTLQPYDLVTAANCYRCHDDLRYHGDRYRGLDTCLSCHGTAGAEDLPRRVAAAAPETAGVSVQFRRLLHRIHMGSSLSNPAAATVGEGPAPYPDNFALFAHPLMKFPALPGRTAACARCHGTDAWQEPVPRDHPTEQGTPNLVWAFTCGSCHDSVAAAAHFAIETPGGVEGCALCHGPGRDNDVVKHHLVR